jgi:LysR family hydrogen peroxide-inducible transcriptional activator
MRPHAFSLRQLQYAIAVAETRGFRSAAERCHVSQPSLSAQIAQLEGVLGARLFERDRRHVLVTAAGLELLACARRILAEADGLTAVAERAGDPLGGTLRIGVIPTVSAYLLPDVVRPLRRDCPRLVVLWHDEKTSVLLQAVREGRLDAVLLALVPGMDDLEREVVAEDPFVLAGPPDHPLMRATRRAKLSDLDGEKILLLDDGHCFRDQALAVCSASGAQEADFRATSLATLIQVVAGGAGLTLLPSLAAKVESRRGDLALRAFEKPAPSRTLVLAWRNQCPRSVAVRKVAEALRDARRQRAGSQEARPDAAPGRRG